MKDLNQLQLKLKTKIDAQPFIKWAGGKRQLLDELEARKPKWFNKYFEPFIGGGALYFRLQPQQSFISDINPELINLYQTIKDDVDGLIAELRKLKYSEKDFYQIRNIDRSPTFRRWNPIKKAARFVYLNKSCFNGLYRMNSKGHFNVPFGNYQNPTILDEYNLRACHELLQATTITCQPFLGIEEYVTKGDFVYFDPPYVPLNKTSFTKYFKDDFDSQMQMNLKDLCDRLDDRGVYFMVSNSHAPLIRNLYKKYDIAKVDAIRAINSKGTGRGKVKEVIITNY